MRVADDLADEPAPLEEKRQGLQNWRHGLNSALAGAFTHPLHPALADTVNRFGLDPAHLHGLLDGVEQDLTPKPFASFAELYQYCFRVASLVGLTCIRIWGCHDAQANEPAEASGIAFQLTNILRDAAEDARVGRVYLPEEDLQRFGCRPEQLSGGPCDAGYQGLMAFEVDRAREYYERARPLTELLPPPGRAVFQIMTNTYRGLLEAIDRRGFAHINGPVRLSRWHKLGLFMQALPVRLGWK
jgi:phytoene synthase